ncbi:MAG: hypothetical protein QM784_11795 [Polyangiaceae bacterium]
MSETEAATVLAKSGIPIPSALPQTPDAIAKALPGAPGKALASVDPAALGAEVESSGWLGSGWFWVAVASCIDPRGRGTLSLAEEEGKVPALLSKAKTVVLDHDPKADLHNFAWAYPLSSCAPSMTFSPSSSSATMPPRRSESSCA